MGKVCGCGCRAGKVKNQTPKVERQEKEKKETGRANMRSKFNKRQSNSTPFAVVEKVIDNKLDFATRKSCSKFFVFYEGSQKATHSDYFIPLKDSSRTFRTEYNNDLAFQRSHSQKSKGVDNRDIQEEKRIAIKERMHLDLYADLDFLFGEC
jgi:small subunit ribosomal protein S30e